MDLSPLGTAFGGFAVALIGWAASEVLKRARRNRTTLQAIDGAERAALAAREQRSWTLMESRIEDLEGALDRLANSERRLKDDLEAKQATIERLRSERDDAKSASTDAALRARDLDQALGAARRMYHDLQNECARQNSEYERRIANLSDDLDDAREQLAEFRRTGPLG